ncbi:unnamed protein product [Effrenium voratum]|nr:unnamed protein product [Effrenium voratum]
MAAVSSTASPERAPVRIVTAEWLKEHLEEVDLLEVAYRDIDGYEEGKFAPWPGIPGAKSVHPSVLEAGWDRKGYYPRYSEPLHGNILPPQLLRELCLELGLPAPKSGKLVVVYGNHPAEESLSAMAAGRVAWGLCAAGYDFEVAILDAGFHTWPSDLPRSDRVWFEPLGGWEAAAERWAQKRQRAYEEIRAGGQPKLSQGWYPDNPYLASTEDVLAAAGRSIVVDIRREDEHRTSQGSYYPFYDSSGHIPGSIWQGNWTNLVDACPVS